MQPAEANALIDVLEAELADPPRSTAQVLLTPKWLGALAFVLVIVSAFLGLGWWQVSRAVTPGDDGSRNTETPVAIDTLLQAGAEIDAQAIEHRTLVDGTLLPQTATVIANRDQSGTVGYWVVAGLATVTTSGAPDGLVPVGIGWTATRDEADALAEKVEAVATQAEQLQLVGRIMPNDGLEVIVSSSADYVPQYVAAAELVNEWPDTDLPWYDAYVVVASGLPDSLTAQAATIVSPPPSTESTVNWLNIFYAAEWVVFAAFAIFLWWRLGRDEYQHALERAAADREELELLRAVAVRGASDGDGAR